MPQQIQALLRQGIAAAKAGQNQQACEALLQVVELDETNVRAWLWLSAVIEDPTDKVVCLQNALELEPDNKAAQIGLARLQQDTPPDFSSSASPGSPAQESPPLDDNASTTAPSESSLPAEDIPSTPSPSRPTTGGSRYKRLSPNTVPVEPASEAGGARCPFCRHPISVMAVECDHCHLLLVVDCPACEERIDVERSNCPACGEKLPDFRHKSVYFAQLAARYQRNKKPHQAVQAWQAARRINPDDPDHRLHLAESQAEANRPKAAVHTLRELLEEEPGQEAASLALGKLYHKLSYWDDAEEVYRQALAVSPNSADLNHVLGWLLVDHSRAREGFDYIRQATELDPKNGMAWFRLAQLYEAMRKSKQATAAYRQAAALLPEHSLAYKKALHQTSMLEPELPQVLSTGWAEFIRQAAGPFLVCLVAVLLDSGLRPWWIPLPGWIALLVGLLGVVLWVSGISLPKNPVICWIVGRQGLAGYGWRMSAIFLGGFLWLLAMAIILFPINQTVPEVPSWILDS